MLNTFTSRLSNRWRNLAQQLPSQCAICHAWPAQRLCHACTARFVQPQPRCRTCAMPLTAPLTTAEQSQCSACRRHPPPLDACIAAVTYGYPWSSAITQFKFNGDPGWAGALAALLRSTAQVEAALAAADWVLPIPLSRQRLQERGFNQSLLLARQLTQQQAPHKTSADLLLRLQHTSAQSQLPRSERLHNLSGAFAIEPLRQPQLQGSRIVLIDDVMTTGATLHASAQVLRQAGAAHITALVVARTHG